jgi:hypothetical protein
MKTLALILLFGATPASFAADPPAATNARVAGGGTVAVVVSKKTAAQWTAERPGVRSLRPRVRGNAE